MFADPLVVVHTVGDGRLSKNSALEGAGVAATLRSSSSDSYVLAKRGGVEWNHHSKISLSCLMAIEFRRRYLPRCS